MLCNCCTRGRFTSDTDTLIPPGNYKIYPTLRNFGKSSFKSAGKQTGFLGTVPPKVPPESCACDAWIVKGKMKLQWRPCEWQQAWCQSMVSLGSPWGPKLGKTGCEWFFVLMMFGVDSSPLGMIHMSEFGIHTGQIASIWAPQETFVQMAVLLKSLCESIILRSRTTGTVIYYDTHGGNRCRSQSYHQMCLRRCREQLPNHLTVPFWTRYPFPYCREWEKLKWYDFF